MAGFPPDSTRVKSEPDQHSQYCFGPFVLDPRRRILLREGERLPLSAKSVDTLLALVERQGETVTKSELLQTVWNEAVVEENSLNKCISEVRRALGERRGQNDYIVTITGVGYRFVAPVSTPAETPGTPEGTAPGIDRRFGSIERKRRVLVWSAVALSAMAAAAIAIYTVRVDRPSKRDLAVILPLQTLPASPDTEWLATAIGEILFHELTAAASSPRLIAPDEAAQMTPDLPRRRKPSETLRDIRAFSGADLAVAGTVTVLADQPGKPLRIDLRVHDLRTGSIIAARSVDGNEAQIFSLVRGLADEVRPALGTALTASGQPSSSHRSPVPVSVRAMQLYAEGLAALRSSDFSKARDLLLEAVSADSSNALCYSALSAAWSGLRYDRNAADAAKRAFDLSTPLDDLDRLAIEARYRLVTRDWSRAAQLYEAVSKALPESIDNAGALVDVYDASGRMEEAKRVIARLRALPAPLRDDPRIDLLEARMAEAFWSDFPRIVALSRQAAEKAQRRGMRSFYAHAILMQSRAAWASGDTASAEMLRHQARSLCDELHDVSCVALTLRGDANAGFLAGRLKDARESYNQALAAARQTGNLDEQLNDLNGLGLLHCGFGDFDAAGRYFQEALRINREAVRRSSAMLLNNYTHVLMFSGRVAESSREAAAALAEARASHEVESEADALADMATLERIAGDPRHAVALNKQALAIARQSGKKMARVEIELDLARAMAATGDADGAREALRQSDSWRGNDDLLEFQISSAEVAFDAGDYISAARLAQAAAESARKSHAPYYEVSAQSLLARAFLAQGHDDEARAQAVRAMAIQQTPEQSLSRLQARFADAASRHASLDALAESARQAGYTELMLEIRIQDAIQASRPGHAAQLRQLAADASARGYFALAAKARQGLRQTAREPGLTTGLP